MRLCSLHPILVIVLLSGPASGMPANPTEKKKADEKENPAHIFTIESEVKRTPIKDQYWTGTCWDFSTTSFIEAELIRMGRGEFDLSEMFTVRHTYQLKSMNYIRRHGAATFGEGGQAHDVLHLMRTYGAVPESAYTGQNIDEPRHNHGEMVAVIQGMLDGVLKKEGKRLTPRWPDAIEAVLDVYLGKPPASFEYQGKTYTPLAFMNDVLQIPFDDYIEMTSYTHHPFFQKFCLEVPDNWADAGDYYNVPIDDFETIIDNALKHGYSVVWDGDVSEKEYSSRETGYGVVPAKEWEDKTKAEQEAKATEPEIEKEVTQEMRQRAFDNFTTTDDHLMHIVGLAHDQKGTKFYLTKNSGGTLDRKFDGYVYLSRSYVRLKTIAIMINKKSLTPEMARKLGIE